MSFGVTVTPNKSEAVKDKDEVKAEIPRSAQRLGRRLRRIREELGLTQEAAAERIGMHRVYVQEIERGVANPTLEMLVSVALGYGVTVEALFARRPRFKNRAILKDRGTRRE